MKYHLVQLGCQMNHADGERIAAVLAAMGYEPTHREDDAELLGVVSCSVRQKSIDKVYSKIAKWNDWKQSRNILTFVSGCILPEDREKFLDRFDLLFSINELPQLPFMIAQYGVTTPLALNADRVREAHELALPLLAEDGSAQAAHNGGRVAITSRDRQAAGLEPETVGANRPIGPLWLRESQGPELLPAHSGETFISVRKQEELAQRRRSSLQVLTVLQGEMANQGGPSTVAQKVLLPGALERKDPMGGFWHIKPTYASGFEAYVPIQNGCDKFCSFCAVPYTRGREVSRPAAEIYQEVADLLSRGYRTVTLLGQNVNSYGLDRPGREPSFAELLDTIGSMADRAAGGDPSKRTWIYFTSPHPRDMGREVLEAIAGRASLAKQIHLPIQSGDDKLLLRMNRNHSVSRYREVVTNIKAILPTATLFTDIIVGFSGETVDQFANTRRIMEEFEYQMAFIAVYSPRPGAASARWEDDVALEEKKRRMAELTEVLHQTSLKYNQAQVGRTVPVLVESADQNGRHVQARTEGRVQVRLNLSEGQKPGDLVGQFVQARIDRVRPLSMEGSLVLA